MAEFKEVARQFMRMFGSGNTEGKLFSILDLMNSPDEFEKGVMEWAAANPESRYPTWREFFAGRYPGSPPVIWLDYRVPADIVKTLGAEPIREGAVK